MVVMTGPGDAPPRRLGAVLAVLLAAQFMTNVDTAIVNVAAPDITVRPGALPRLQRGFVDADPRIEPHILERSGSFSHLEEPDTVIDLVRAFLR
jgi:hypothetical protein